MAKKTNLELLNRVLRNIGEDTVSDLTSLNDIQMLSFNALNEAIIETATEDFWQPLESLGTITMTTSVYSYDEPSDLWRVDIYSFRQTDKKNNLDFLTPQEWDDEYPEGIGTDKTGYPTEITRFGGKFYINKQPTSTQNGKYIRYRYWKRPTLFTTATDTSTCWIPEGFDETLLVDYATFKVLSHQGDDEAKTYYVKVFGDGKLQEGSLNKMRRIFKSGLLKPRVTYHF